MKNNPPNLSLTEKIIRLYFGQRFNSKQKARFARWYMADDDREEKERLTRLLWNECAAPAADNQTRREWLRLEQRIEASQTSFPQRNHRLRWFRYAALWMGVLCSIWWSYENGKHHNPTLPPEREYSERYVSYGSVERLQLPEGTVVWLNAGSVLIYPKTFDQARRSVYLSGEAHFDVSPNPDKPFVVQTKQMNIEALGTVFNVESYPGSEQTSVTLEEGSIRVDGVAAAHLSRVLIPNERLTIKNGGPEYSVSHVDASEYSSWKEGFLVFKEADFPHIIASLERKYNVSIHYPAGRFKNLSLFYRIAPNETIDESLSVLSHLSGNFHYSIKGKEITIR